MSERSPYTCKNFLKHGLCDNRLMDLFRVTNTANTPSHMIDFKKLSSSICAKCQNYVLEENPKK